jgi:hypothetical protein
MDGDRSASKQNDCHDTKGNESGKKMRHPCLGLHVHHQLGMLRRRLKVARKVTYPFHMGAAGHLLAWSQA